MNPDSDADGGSSSLIFVFLGVALIYAVLAGTERTAPNLKHIPTPGFSNYLLSYLDALRLVRDGSRRLEQGYAKNWPGVFKLATLTRWVVIVTGTQHIEELRMAPEDEVSYGVAANEPDTAEYLLGHARTTSAPQASELARRLTQSLPFLIPEIRAEIAAALADGVRQDGQGTEVTGTEATEQPETAGWTEVDAAALVARTTARVVGRLVFGVEFVRDAEYIFFATRDAHSSGIHNRGMWGWKPVLAVLPAPLRWIMELCSGEFWRRRRMRKKIAAFVRERRRRQRNIEVKGDQAEAVEYHHDLLSRILDGEGNDTRTSEQIAESLFELSQSAMRMISMNFTQALCYLAVKSEYVVPLRKEVESIVGREGWATRECLDKMRKVDSFLKESMRLSGVSELSTMRQTLTPFVFWDGTELPAGTVLFSASGARHRDAALYASPNAFDGFRFSEEEESEGSVRSQWTTTGPGYLGWGYGRHACPGRFVAAAVMKMMLGQMILHWDVRHAEGARQPEDGRILFRKRVKFRAI